MSRIFFTADAHLGHEAIIKYANRPFRNLDHMHDEIIKRWNEKVTPDDLIYHIGDFAFKGCAKEFEDKLNGTIVHIRGNHDKNNGVNTALLYTVMQHAGLIIYATHIPPLEDQRGTIESNIVDICDIILCGHVHDNWKWSLIRNKYCVNVGVDVWNFQPINIQSVLKLIAKVKKGYYETNVKCM